MCEYAFDFETTTDPNDCRVWAWGAVNIETFEFDYGNNIETFIDFLNEKRITKGYFHNLKFDGEFILQYLIRNNYTWVEKPIHDKEYSTLITDRNVFYNITIKLNNTKIKIHDSLKILPTTIEKLGKYLDIGIEKLEIDYKQYRPIGYILTDTEKEYLKHDVLILAHAIKIMKKRGGTKNTIGSNAMSFYKNLIGEKKFKKYFPVINENDMRQGYRGGFTYASEQYRNSNISNGVVYDINSMYPSIMRNSYLPWGQPIAYEGEYKFDNTYPLYIGMVRFNFDLKENHIPCIQLKYNFRFNSVEYLKTSNGEPVTMVVTNIDWERIKKQYNVWEIEYLGGYKFRSRNDMFTDYVDYWMDLKVKDNDNELLRFMDKLYLNNLYGKFGTNPVHKSKRPFAVDDEGKVKYISGKIEIKDPVYLPVAMFVTSYGRDKIINDAQSEYSRFLYCDTDSLHFKGLEQVNIPVDKVKLGCYKKEYEFDKARYIRSKCYIEIEGDNKHIACAGMPKSCYDYVTYENFKVGASYNGKLMSKRVNGGTVLIETTFKIK